MRLPRNSINQDDDDRVKLFYYTADEMAEMRAKEEEAKELEREQKRLHQQQMKEKQEQQSKSDTTEEISESGGVSVTSSDSSLNDNEKSRDIVRALFTKMSLTLV